LQKTNPQGWATQKRFSELRRGHPPRFLGRDFCAGRVGVFAASCTPVHHSSAKSSPGDVAGSLDFVSPSSQPEGHAQHVQVTANEYRFIERGLFDSSKPEPFPGGLRFNVFGAKEVSVLKGCVYWVALTRAVNAKLRSIYHGRIHVEIVVRAHSIHAPSFKGCWSQAAGFLENKIAPSKESLQDGLVLRVIQSQTFPLFGALDIMASSENCYSRAHRRGLISFRSAHCTTE